MKDYYKNKVDIAEEQLRLCKIGFVSEMKIIGNGLMNSDDIKSVSERVEKINRMKTAVDELEQTLASAQKNLQECLGKESKEEKE